MTISGRADQSHQQNSITIDYLQAFITNESIHICFIVHGYRQPSLVNYTINNTYIAAPNMSFLFGGNKVAQPAQFEISTNLRLEQPSTSKLAAFVAASEQKAVQNDFHFYVLNENKSKAFNRKKVSLPAAARQQLYDLSPWSVGLGEDDLHISFNDLQVPLQQPQHSVTAAHEPIKHLKDILKKHGSFYVFPGNDKKDQPPNYLSSKIWSKAIKKAFAELKAEDDSKTYSGWITMETWEKHTTAHNHLLYAAGPLIDLKWAVDKVVCHHGTSPRIPTRAFSLKDGNLPERPFVSIHVNSGRKANEPIDYKNYDSRGMNLQAALQTINIQKTISSIDVNLRFDAHRDILYKYYNDIFLKEVGENKNPTPVSERTLTNVRGFQKFINHTFEPGQENVSLNSKNAAYPLGGGAILRSPHEKFLRFEWHLPAQRANRLLQLVLNHEWSRTGYIFVIRVSDLEAGNLYQLQASREMIASHPEMDAMETWSILCKAPHCKPPRIHLKGTTLRTKMSVLANLDVSGVPCDGGRNPVQSFAWNAFNNDGIVLFYGPEASLVRFWNSTASNEAKQQSPQLTPILPHTWATPPNPTSFEVRAPTSERTLHAQIVAGLFGPFAHWRKAADPTYEGNVFRAEYKNPDSIALAHGFTVNGTAIVCAHPNELRKATLMAEEAADLTPENKIVMAGTRLGSQAFISALVEEDERLANLPLPSEEKINLMDAASPNDESDGALAGVLVTPHAFDVEQEEELLEFVNHKIQGWDTSTRRNLKHFGFSHDKGGGNIAKCEAIPTSLETIKQLAQQLLNENDVNEEINQCTVADYPPAVGITEHLENFMLGKVVVTANLLISVPMHFVHKDGGDRTTIILERYSLVALTGKNRFNYKHGIPSAESDMINGESVRRERRISLIFRSVPHIDIDDGE